MMDILFDDLVRDRSDPALLKAVRELNARDVKPTYLVRKVARDLGAVYSIRLRRLLEKKRPGK